MLKKLRDAFDKGPAAPVRRQPLARRVRNAGRLRDV